MKAWFRPMPGLTIVTIIALAILIALGTWQYQRLQWKTALLADVEAVAEAPPFRSLNEVQNALESGQPIDFRRIAIEAEYTPSAHGPFFVFTPQNRDISWRVFSPVKASGITVFAALKTIPDKAKDAGINPPEGTVSAIGYVRLARPAKGAAKSTPEKNRWFGFNPLPETDNWNNTVPGGADMRFYIDTVPGAQNADDLRPRRPDIRNNHFDYMLTWYGLALVLLVIYLIMHRRAGRLGRA